MDARRSECDGGAQQDAGVVPSAGTLGSATIAAIMRCTCGGLANSRRAPILRGGGQGGARILARACRRLGELHRVLR